MVAFSAEGRREGDHAFVRDAVPREIERLKARERLLADGGGEGLHVVLADLVAPKVEDRQRWQRAVFEDGGDDVDVCAVQALLCQIEPAVPAPSNRKLAQDEGFRGGTLAEP